MPLVDVAAALQFTLADHRVVIVQEDGVPVGMCGVRRERITSWDEIVKVPGDVAVHRPRARCSRTSRWSWSSRRTKVVGVVTQEAYLAGLWGRGALNAPEPGRRQPSRRVTSRGRVRSAASGR